MISGNIIKKYFGYIDVYHSPYFSLIFYGVLAIYIGVNKLKDSKYAINDLYRYIFKGTGLFFMFYFITEGIAFFDIKNYDKYIPKTNLFLSGGLFIICLFILLTFKIWKHDKKRMGRHND
jgi:hypothetical protein